jgi:hypothetical protein
MITGEILERAMQSGRPALNEGEVWILRTDHRSRLNVEVRELLVDLAKIPLLFVFVDPTGSEHYWSEMANTHLLW